MTPENLLITEDWIGRELASRLGAGRCARCEDPYEALRQVSSRAWSAIVLTRPQEDLPGYCRALHRLRADVPIYVWCSPEGESQLRPLMGREVQGTFLYPPTPPQLQRCIRAIARPSRPSAEAAPARLLQAEPVSMVSEVSPVAPTPTASLTTAELMDLVRAARSIEKLESEIQQLLERRLNLQTEWTDEAGGLRELLAIEGPPRRVLVPAAGSEIVPETEAYLESLHLCLSGVVAVTKRGEWLRHLAITDELTGLFNRRYFYMRTDRILRRMQQQSGQAMLVLFDLDNFKHYNDTHGHAVGDDILRELSSMMRKTLRENDLVARIGGDEFAVLIWEAEPPRLSHSRSIQSALALVRRFAETIRRHAFSVLGEESHGSLTLSGGAAIFGPDGETCRELMRSADRALLRAKDNGKGVIQLLGENQP